jgi:hypothetical protein
MADDSFLQRVLKDRTKQRNVLDNTSKLMSARPTHINTPPLNPNAGGDIGDIGIDGTGGASAGIGAGIGGGGELGGGLPQRPDLSFMTGQGGQAQGNGAVEPTGAPLFEGSAEMPRPVVEQLDAALTRDELESQFYARTGRAMNRQDRLMIQARHEFWLKRGRSPSPAELTYELQRGIIADRDSNISSLA